MPYHSTLRVQSRADEIGLSVDDIKRNMGVVSDADNALIGGYLAAAVGLLEENYGLSIFRTEIWLNAEKFFGRRIELRRANNCELLSVNYFDVAGVELQFDLAKVRREQDVKSYEYLTARYGSEWPAHYPEFGDVVVKYKAGWAAADAGLPALIKQAVMLIVCEWYGSQAETSDVKKYKISNNVDVLMMPYKTI